MALDDQPSTMDGEPGINVGHEKLRVEWALGKPHPTRRFSFTQPASPLPTSRPGAPSQHKHQHHPQLAVKWHESGQWAQ